MNQRLHLLAASIAGFAGGVLAGMLFAPTSGRDLRRSLATHASDPAHWVEGRFHEIEQQLSALEKELRSSGNEFGDRLREATHKAVSHYVPDVPDDPDAWHVGGSEVTRELPGLPQ